MSIEITDKAERELIERRLALLEKRMAVLWEMREKRLARTRADTPALLRPQAG